MGRCAPACKAAAALQSEGEGEGRRVHLPPTVPLPCNTRCDVHSSGLLQRAAFACCLEYSQTQPHQKGYFYHPYCCGKKITFSITSSTVYSLHPVTSQLPREVYFYRLHCSTCQASRLQHTSMISLIFFESFHMMLQ